MPILSENTKFFPLYPNPIILLIAIFFGRIDRMANLNSMVFVEYVLKSRREGLEQYGWSLSI